jgi:hypothetical protein
VTDAGIRPGFTAKLHQRTATPRVARISSNCWGPLAKTAFQTVQPLHWSKGGRPAIMDGCRAYVSDGDIVRRHWREFSTGDPSLCHPAIPGTA